jgi:thioesterase domain-containing protein
VPAMPAAADRSDDEDRIQTIMMAVLGLSAREWSFDRTLADYGLNSLLLITMLGQIRSHYPGFRSEWIKPHHTAREVVLRLAELDAAPTSREGARSGQVFPELIQLNTKTRGRPVFWIHGALGSVEAYQAIADRSDRPFYAIQARGFMTPHAPLHGVQAMAAYYIEAIRSVQAQGPYDIGGFCLGGIIAYEMTRQLQEQGQTVDTLAMVDSPDNTAFRSAAPQNIPLKNAALQVANILLWPPGESDLTTIMARMISQDEVDTGATDDDFIRRLAELAVERGLAMRQDRIEAFIRQNMAVQVGYRLHEFRILPLPRPDAVRCAYFRNRHGLFYGTLGPYFTTAGDGFSLDNVVYWQDWQRELAQFQMVDIEASNHMTILFEPRSLETIVDVCEDLYASDALETCA